MKPLIPPTSSQEQAAKKAASISWGHAGAAHREILAILSIQSWKTSTSGTLIIFELLTLRLGLKLRQCLLATKPLHGRALLSNPASKRTQEGDREEGGQDVRWESSAWMSELWGSWEWRVGKHVRAE